MSIQPAGKTMLVEMARAPLASASNLAAVLRLPTDRTFKHRLGSYENFLSLIPKGNSLTKLEGLPQFATHGGLDPLQHTYNALKLLNTDAISQIAGKPGPAFDRSMPELVRIAVLYHDIGKLDRPLDPGHPARSAEIAAPILADPRLSGVGPLNRLELPFVVMLIRTHALLGELMKHFEQGEADFDHAALIRETFRGEVPFGLSLPSVFQVHTLIARADISSIPGLRENLQSGEQFIADLLRLPLELPRRPQPLPESFIPALKTRISRSVRQVQLAIDHNAAFPLLSSINTVKSR